MKNSIALRTEKYFQLSSRIAQLNNAQLRSLLNHSESSLGFGTNQTISLGQSQVFVKRVPVTDIEHNNLFSTKNLYNLPAYFNYGLGSAGLGVFRELVTHIKTTHWVLEGEISTFPLMYHYRIMPFSGQPTKVDRAWLKSFVEYWGSSKNVEKYMLEKGNANHELVLFLEHIPHVLSSWLQENPGKFQQPLNDLCKTMAFLRAKEVIHLDAHFQNVLTDGDQIYLTDFGLVLNRSFALTKDEETFFEQNVFYDYGEILLNLGHLVVSLYDSCSESDKGRVVKKFNLKKDLTPPELRSILLNNIEQIQADGMMHLDECYVASMVKYRSIVVLMHNFFSDMRRNPKKDTPFPQAKLRSLLEETGFLSEAELSI
ncbi:MAG: hypothetical protein HC886_17465 [Leptolyngbyaceae cyanobacterium SM1_1_3]|nr:hypothetical protein [Leptolyngbyaceae cyanobacterium SM1_1_3]NJN02717.1 hypothetical protein [Leptolyngbyaceae cyanobacterium RM1_1_2]NJO11631.1 hypothetical protein [Leptolyngbyaceae cyanobacterium SL_1_1]